MRNTHQEIIRHHCKELLPLPTQTEAELRPIENVRAVLFDIYGTMLISGAGDISLGTSHSNDDAFRDALRACGLTDQEILERCSATTLKEVIHQQHAIQREQQIEYPEVDIVSVWRDVVARIGDAQADAIDFERLAIEYEVRINPVWPMPGLKESLSQLQEMEMALGVISNAQAMTQELFPALLSQSLNDLGFLPSLQLFSYQQKESKPSLKMFRAAKTMLLEMGISPKETVFVGNDALNDIWTANQVGFRTILFAGDARSLRLRADDELAKDCMPDAIVKNLASIIQCVKPPTTLN